MGERRKAVGKNVDKREKELIEEALEEEPAKEALRKELENKQPPDDEEKPSPQPAEAPTHE